MDKYEIVITRLDNPEDVVVYGPIYSKYAAKKRCQRMEDKWGLIHYSIKVRKLDEETINQ